MQAKGRNVIVVPDKKEKKLKSGIILPDQVKRKNQEWGTVVDGNNGIHAGNRVLYRGNKCYEKDGEKVVGINKILYWE